MKTEPFMWATFCDDVRQEVGNKLSYLGIYGANLVVPQFPNTLLKLCCIISVRIPAKAPPRSVILRLLKGEETLFESDLSAALEAQAAAVPANDSDNLAITISTIAQLINFPVTERCFLKARAVVDGKELGGGTLELMAAEKAP